MTISLIFKIASVGIVVLVLNQVLKNSGKDEYVSMVNLAGLLLVIFWILPYIKELFDTVKSLFSL